MKAAFNSDSARILFLEMPHSRMSDSNLGLKKDSKDLHLFWRARSSIFVQMLRAALVESCWPTMVLARNLKRSGSGLVTSFTLPFERMRSWTSGRLDFDASRRNSWALVVCVLGIRY